jgi:Utp11 protein
VRLAAVVRGGMNVDPDDPEAVAAAAGVVPARVHTARTMRRAQMKSQKAYVELDQRLGRADKLDMAMEDLALRHNLLSKGRRKKVVVGDPQAGILPVFKWKKERKR